ncbi:MAG: hypothetical protein AAF799_45330 [Myxococcota bacterium]
MPQEVKIAKLGVNDDLKASRVAIDQVGHYLVTATKNEGGNLQVTSWFLDPNGTPRPYDRAVGGGVGIVDIRHVGNGVFATSVENAVGNLEIITWSLSPLGKITRHEEIVFGKVSAIATDAFEYHNKLVVAVVDSAGKVRIKLLDIDKETHALEQLDNEIGNDSSLVDIETAGTRLINLYSRDADGNFKVSSFLHGHEDVRPSRGEPYGSGNLGAIKVAKRGGRRRSNKGSRVALIDGHGGLRVTSLGFGRSRTERGAIEITRHDSTKAPVGKAISIASNDRDFGFWTAVQGADQKLRVDFWGYGDPLVHHPEGAPVNHGSHTDSQAINDVVCASPYYGNHLVTAATTDGGGLVVAAWRADGVQQAD